VKIRCKGKLMGSLCLSVVASVTICHTLIHLHSASQLQDNKRPCSAGYDMQFDIKYAYFNLLESLAAIV
jgi:hypothetical protein